MLQTFPLFLPIPASLRISLPILSSPASLQLCASFTAGLPPSCPVPQNIYMRFNLFVGPSFPERSRKRKIRRKTRALRAVREGTQDGRAVLVWNILLIGKHVNDFRCSAQYSTKLAGAPLLRVNPLTTELNRAVSNTIDLFLCVHANLASNLPQHVQNEDWRTININIKE